jgi:hypothetical protein
MATNPANFRFLDAFAAARRLFQVCAPHRQADQAISVDPVHPPLGEHARVATPVRKRGPVCRRCGGRAPDVLVDEGLEATAGGGALAAPAAKRGKLTLPNRTMSAVASLRNPAFVHGIELRFFADRAAKKWPLRGSLKLGVGCL